MFIRAPRTLLTLSALAVAPAASVAQDMAPPLWRGGPLTTYQQYDFSGGASGGAPDVIPYYNPYGVPNLASGGDATWLPGITPAAAGPRSDVWRLQDVPGGAEAAVRIDNSNVPLVFNGAPTPGIFASGKLDTCQVMFFGDVPSIRVEPVPGMGDFFVTQDSLTIITLADGWSHMTVHHTYWTDTGVSPGAERIFVSAPAGGTSFIDGVIFDTQAIPTPGAGTLLALAGIAAARRRRRAD